MDVHFSEYIKDILEIKDGHIRSFRKNTPSNDLFLIEKDQQKYIVKRYPNSHLFYVESYVLTLCNANNIKVPRLLHVGDEFQYKWILYEYAEGIALHEINPKTEDLSMIWKEIGTEIRAIHDLMLDFSSKPDTSFIDKVVSDTEVYLQALDESVESRRITTFMKNIYPYLVHPDHIKLIIKDFTSKHIILHKRAASYKLSALLDFEQARVGNLFTDFVFLYIEYFFDNNYYEKSFLEGYGISLEKRDREIIAFFILQYLLETLFSSRKRVETQEYVENVMKKMHKWLDTVSIFL